MDCERLVQDLLDRALALVRNDPLLFGHWRLHLLPDWVGEILPTLNSDEWVAFIRDHKEYSFVY
jgi:hypothetical protein